MLLLSISFAIVHSFLDVKTPIFALLQLNHKISYCLFEHEYRIKIDNGTLKKNPQYPTDDWIMRKSVPTIISSETNYIMEC